MQIRLFEFLRIDDGSLDSEGAGDGEGFENLEIYMILIVWRVICIN